MDEPIFQHPLAYLLGLEGLALLRGWAGDYGENFTRERLAEVRQLLDDPGLTSHPGVPVARATLGAGYRRWAGDYDGPNRLFTLDEPFVHGVVDRLPAGVALDAACGTGRFAETLTRRGHRVIGVDGSADMLRVARSRVPSARFALGDLRRLPVADMSVDLVVCALALSHVASLEPVMAEFARVLTPGGHLVISDVHHELVFRGSVIAAPGPAGEPGLVPTYRHPPGDFLRAALAQGLEVRACEEPGLPTGTAPGPDGVGPWRDWPWSLMDLLPEARDAAWDVPLVINWHFQGAPRSSASR
ncbi:class I SAM-dependent methyltransferase [Kineosporia sp. J2-2]|uniref:Class I SAM-dependent methyltransferase n=1 Tax=Kineosporia corallincola TaxID=2835133 RepID=A0ABS5TAS2_9ACTN|nr:class I SAM-dependent methyltransferase [Kineosporia corallincola]MBT0768160.1 class I SAM-dependent methyltransferase [Kineosporia corallincola]